MKNILTSILLIISLGACKVQKQALSEQIGPGKSYTDITYSPLVGNSSSKEFAEKWSAAEKGTFDSGKRILQRLTLSFSNEGNLLANFGYVPPNGKGIAPAIFTYSVQKDDKGALKFSLISKNANAKVISAGVRGITDQFLEKYKFKIDWVLDKVPGSYGELAGLQCLDMPEYWFYGAIK